MGYHISSEKLNNPLLKDLLKELNSFFSSLQMDFYIIGATARDLILSNLHDLIPGRKTADIGYCYCYIRLEPVSNYRR